jgi:membrane-bound lytic murein transglycosylase D
MPSNITGSEPGHQARGSSQRVTRRFSNSTVNRCLSAGMCSLAMLGLLSFAGCDDATRNTTQVRPPEIKAAPEQVAKAPGAPVLYPLPFLPRPGHSISILGPLPESGLDLILSYAQWYFDAGQQDFRAGHLARARQEFDLSVDTLIGSGYAINSDPRLAAAFHRIVETISSEEFAAFREGDGFSEQKAEGAPIDEIPEISVPAPGTLDPRLAAGAAREITLVPHDLPLTVNEYVLVYLNFFQTPRGRAIVETGLRRAGRYRPMIERVLDEEGLPRDLIYLAQAESAFQPTAASRARCVGIWQFAAWRGHEYGLQRNWWIDERQDPEKSTRAAAHHLHDLYDQFGDWYLAMAAYDTGPGNVQKAIERTGYADFWELYKRNVLLKETRNYVPIILALTLIAKDPQRYGIQVTPEPFPEIDRVKPGKPIDLRLVAETIDVDVQALRGLNPVLLRTVTPNDPNFELRLPAGTGGRFLTENAAIPPEKWVTWRRHLVNEGETLSEIARTFHVTPAAIADANELDIHARLQSGQKLIIPATAPSEPALGKLTYYRVRKGDTVESVAEQYSVSSSDVVKWNHLASQKLARGMRLRVYPGGLGAQSPAASKSTHPATPSVATTSAPQPVAPKSQASPVGAVTHKVEPGETLWSIAQAYHTTAEALRITNRFLFTRPLQVGDLLTILQPR